MYVSNVVYYHHIIRELSVLFRGKLYETIQ